MKMPCCVYVKRGQEIHLVDFFYGAFDTTILMEEVERKYPKHRKLFHTDATATQRHTGSGGQTNLTIIESYGYKVKNLRKNPNRIDRVNATNSLILSANGIRKLFINKSLKRLVETMERYTFDSNGLPSKSHAYYDDVYDSLSYGCYPYTKFGRGGLKVSGFKQ